MSSLSQGVQCVKPAVQVNVVNRNLGIVSPVDTLLEYVYKEVTICFGDYAIHLRKL